ncbi:MAG: shikimate dehydrogenase [Candidatus Nanopelagicales bacterium]|nr:shikimate dehydrogenase [Candidatus Nanopelagicales bacterium]
MRVASDDSGEWTRGERQAAVLGSPIAHSLSPVLHLAAYRALGLNWRYRAIEVEPAGLVDFVAGCDESWAGLSLTMPLKEAVLDLLDEADDLVRLTGAANTLVFRGGRRLGFNTDVYGMGAALREGGIPDGARRAAVIGAGATARSAVVALSQLGIEVIDIVARRPEAAAQPLRLARELGVAARALPWDSAAQALGAEVVVSTVPAGAADSLSVLVPDLVSVSVPELFPGGPGLLLDVVYSPWPTALARQWRAFGGKVVGGLSMLTWQAAEQVHLMTGRDAPVEKMRKAGEAALI